MQQSSVPTLERVEVSDAKRVTFQLTAAVTEIPLLSSAQLAPGRLNLCCCSLAIYLQCASLWMATPVGTAVGCFWEERLSLSLALSAAAGLLRRLGSQTHRVAPEAPMQGPKGERKLEMFSRGNSKRQPPADSLFHTTDSEAALGAASFQHVGEARMAADRRRYAHDLLVRRACLSRSG
jgi:hypothetical protein